MSEDDTAALSEVSAMDENGFVIIMIHRMIAKLPEEDREALLSEYCSYCRKRGDECGGFCHPCYDE